MTTSAVAPKNVSAFTRSGIAVTATSAMDVAKQAGIDWTVSLTDLQATYTRPIGNNDTFTHRIPVTNKQAVIKTMPGSDVPESVIGVVGKRYQPFQNAEIFSSLDSIVDTGEARYSAAGEYDNGGKVWMLLQLPDTMEIQGDPHAAFIFAKTSHDGSSSVIIRPVIERLFCANQINKIYRGKNKLTYTLRHTTNAVLDLNEIKTIMQLTHTSMQEYTSLANVLMDRKVERINAVNYFKRVFPLLSKVEESPIDLLSVGEKRARTRALTARAAALNIYEHSETQENIRGSQFGLWQAVVEYADHNGNSRKSAIATITERNDNIKLRALELLTK
jgi:phage/plasmid-like protein (TIGR03299 family)